MNAPSNLPPGVTDYDIEKAAGAFDPVCGCGEPATTERDDGTPLCDECKPSSVPCSVCGKPTTLDIIYGDLCYQCCRAENE